MVVALPIGGGTLPPPLAEVGPLGGVTTDEDEDELLVMFDIFELLLAFMVLFTGLGPWFINQAHETWQ